MKSRLLHEDQGQRTYVLVFEAGDEVCERLLDFARAERLGAASVSAIGAFRRAMVAYYDPDARRYEPIGIDEQVEVLSLGGDIVLGDAGEPRLHLHATLGKRDGSAWGGHLVSAEVRPTLEVILTESPPSLRRRGDPETGLALIDLEA